MTTSAELNNAPLTITDSDRSRPSPAFVARMRSLFPVEQETDFLKQVVEGPLQISQQRWFAGGASKIQMGFTLASHAPGRGQCVDRMVIRMEPTELINSTSRRREHQLLKAISVGQQD